MLTLRHVSIHFKVSRCNGPIATMVVAAVMTGVQIERGILPIQIKEKAIARGSIWIWRDVIVIGEGIPTQKDIPGGMVRIQEPTAAIETDKMSVVVEDLVVTGDDSV